MELLSEFYVSTAMGSNAATGLNEASLQQTAKMKKKTAKKWS